MATHPTEGARPPVSDHLKGVLLVVVGITILSPDALILRLLALDPFTILIWRGLGTAAIMGLIAWRLSPSLRHMPMRVLRYGLIISVVFSASQFAFVTGVIYTNAANVLVLVSASPIFAAILSRILLHERLPRRTVWAIVFGMIGVIVTVFGATAGPSVGDLIAAFVPIGLAIVFTVTRVIGPRNVYPFYALSGVITACASGAFGDPLSPGADQSTLLALLIVISAVSFALMSAAPKYIPSAEVGLLLLIETILGPLWIWLGIGEAPSIQAWIGGAILLTTLAVHSWLALKAERTAIAAESTVG